MQDTEAGTVDEDWEVLLSFLPQDWRELAQDTGALKGLRKDKAVDNLLRTLLLHLGCGHSLRETVVRARQAHLADLSDVALLKRLKKSKGWLVAVGNRVAPVPRSDPYVRVNAYGSYLGWVTANRVTSQLAVSAQPPVTRRPGPASGACFGLADSPWLRPFPPATPQAFARPCSPPSPVLLPHPTSSFRASSDTESSFPLRPRFDCRGRMKTSQVPTKDVRTCMGSPTPWSPPSPHHCGDVGVAFDRCDSLGAPDVHAFDAQ